jgi:hypothetical protein
VRSAGLRYLHINDSVGVVAVQSYGPVVKYYACHLLRAPSVELLESHHVDYKDVYRIAFITVITEHDFEMFDFFRTPNHDVFLQFYSLCLCSNPTHISIASQGLRSLEVLRVEDIEAAKAKSGYAEDDSIESEIITDEEFRDDNDEEDSAPSIPFPSVSLSKGDLSRLWDPILRNRSDNGDLEGCMEIITMLREASISRNVSQWERVFDAAFIALKPRKISPLNIAKPTPDSDVTTLLTAMMTVDKIQPSKSILHKCLKHFAHLDNPVKAVEVLRILKQCRYPINNDILSEIEDMKSFDLVLDMFGDF